MLSRGSHRGDLLPDGNIKFLRHFISLLSPAQSACSLIFIRNRPILRQKKTVIAPRAITVFFLFLFDTSSFEPLTGAQCLPFRRRSSLTYSALKYAFSLTEEQTACKIDFRMICLKVRPAGKGFVHDRVIALLRFSEAVKMRLFRAFPAAAVTSGLDIVPKGRRERIKAIFNEQDPINILSRTKLQSRIMH